MRRALKHACLFKVEPGEEGGDGMHGCRKAITGPRMHPRVLQSEMHGASEDATGDGLGSVIAGGWWGRGKLGVGEDEGRGRWW